jgi:hypothetical protein
MSTSDSETYDLVGNAYASVFHPDRIVVYFRARGGGGWSWGPTTLDYVSMPSYTNTCISKPIPGATPFPSGSCAGAYPNDTLLSHEIGHYLGLPHTHNDSLLNKCASITLQNTDGDLGGQERAVEDDVRDTNPDPGPICAPTSSLSCPGGTIVINGITFNPPWNNIMSYHDCLPEAISLDQKKVIARTLKFPKRRPIPR